MTADTAGSAFLIPGIGSQQGAGGTFFHTDLLISNFRDQTQRIRITILERDKANVPPTPPTVVIRDLPSFSDDGDLGLVSEDFLASVGKSGVAAILVEAITPAGALDTAAWIDGYARIWTPIPQTAACNLPGGTVSQSLLSVPPDAIKGADFSAFTAGLRQDEDFRTNVGIVNLSTKERTWRVTSIGSRLDVPDFTITVKPMSMTQVPMPSGNFGVMSISFTVVVTAGQPANNDPWAAYGSTVDNRTGDSWTREASY